jgi:hypothetical protein
MTKTALLAGTYLSLALLIAAPATAQESSRYQTWEAGQNTTQEMVDKLRKLIEEAERARAADPLFLGDLKALANDYDGLPPPGATAPPPPDTSPPVHLIDDDFRDGDYTKATNWSVTGGRWWVEDAVGLRSLVAASVTDAAPATTPEPERPERSNDDLAEAILGGILDQIANGGEQSREETPPTESQPTQQTTGANAEHAVIQTAKAVPNAFSMRLEITSRERHGEFLVSPYQVSPGEGWGYRLAYTPSGQYGLRLLRFSRGQQTVVAYHNGRVDLEDGRLHILEWDRSATGAMTVKLDGKHMMQVTDTRLRDPFDGLAMSNRGGDYAVRKITVNRAQ